MKKYKVCLDTSVVSHLWQPDAHEKMQETIMLWNKLKAGPLGAVIGGASGNERIENTTIVHDNTETYIYYFVGSDKVSIISINGLNFYQTLKMQFSEKEYAQVMIQNKIICLNLKKKFINK